MDGQEDSLCVLDDATIGDDHAVEDLRQLVILILPGCVTNQLNDPVASNSRIAALYTVVQILDLAAARIFNVEIINNVKSG